MFQLSEWKIVASLISPLELWSLSRNPNFVSFNSPKRSLPSPCAGGNHQNYQNKKDHFSFLVKFHSA